LGDDSSTTNEGGVVSLGPPLGRPVLAQDQRSTTRKVKKNIFLKEV